MKILVTGVAGFIGNATALQLLQRGDEVIGLDNLNDYYDVNLKKARLKRLESFSKFKFELIDLCDEQAINTLFKSSFDMVIHLAAQAGVRYSIENPNVYVQSNVVGFTHILEACRHNKVKHLVYASTSSVYGANTAMPFNEGHRTDHPVSFYAATKKANEVMAHSYASLYGLPVTGLRFFTVYGPWGRPDMALFKFTKNILEDKPIDVYNKGNMERDFTYVDDIVTGIIKAAENTAMPSETWDSNNPDSGTSYAPYRIFNIGNSGPVKLMDYVQAIEEALDKKADLNLLPMQSGDVHSTYADTTRLEETVHYKPETDVRKGVAEFIKWYKTYYQVCAESAL